MGLVRFIFVVGCLCGQGLLLNGFPHATSKNAEKEMAYIHQSSTAVSSSTQSASDNIRELDTLIQILSNIQNEVKIIRKDVNMLTCVPANITEFAWFTVNWIAIANFLISIASICLGTYSLLYYPSREIVIVFGFTCFFVGIIITTLYCMYLFTFKNFEKIMMILFNFYMMLTTFFNRNNIPNHPNSKPDTDEDKDDENGSSSLAGIAGENIEDNENTTIIQISGESNDTNFQPPAEGSTSNRKASLLSFNLLIKKIISKFREITTISESGQIELPQIVVVGSQSSGKSFVLEGVVGWDFLPQGTDIVIRRPLVLNMANVYLDDSRRKREDLSVIEGVWTMFLQLRQEIIDDTDKVAGEEKGVSKTPIQLTIYSADVIDLSLVDLPGAVCYTTAKQSSTLKEDIDNIIGTYLSNPKAIILAVHPANTDIANSGALNAACKYDPEGERTLCVLTKIDIMDKGTSAHDLLTGKDVHVKRGVIGIRNRSQAEIMANVTVGECLVKEAEFFRTNYRNLASTNGMHYLRNQLNLLLGNHIISNLPALRDSIVSMIEEQKNILVECGPAPSKEKGAVTITVNKVIRDFVEVIKGALGGYQESIETDKLIGGAIINVAFKDFTSVDEILPGGGLTMRILYHALRNSHGTRVPKFIPQHCMEQLAMLQIERLDKPSVDFVEMQKFYINIRHPEFKVEDEKSAESEDIDHHSDTADEDEEDDLENFSRDHDDIEDCRKLKKLVVQHYLIVRNSLQYPLPKAIIMNSELRKNTLMRLNDLEHELLREISETDFSFFA